MVAIFEIDVLLYVPKIKHEKREKLNKELQVRQAQVETDLVTQGNAITNGFHKICIICNPAMCNRTLDDTPSKENIIISQLDDGVKQLQQNSQT